MDSCRTKSEVTEYKYSFRDVKNQKKKEDGAVNFA